MFESRPKLKQIEEKELADARIRTENDLIRGGATINEATYGFNTDGPVIPTPEQMAEIKIAESELQLEAEVLQTLAQEIEEMDAAENPSFAEKICKIYDSAERNLEIITASVGCTGFFTTMAPLFTQGDDSIRKASEAAGITVMATAAVIYATGALVRKMRGH